MLVYRRHGKNKQKTIKLNIYDRKNGRTAILFSFLAHWQHPGLPDVFGPNIPKQEKYTK
jgi:hypothetical protein